MMAVSISSRPAVRVAMSDEFAPSKANPHSPPPAVQTKEESWSYATPKKGFVETFDGQMRLVVERLAALEHSLLRIVHQLQILPRL
jgi:hypothetical protein